MPITFCGAMPTLGPHSATFLSLDPSVPFVIIHVPPFLPQEHTRDWLSYACLNNSVSRLLEDLDASLPEVVAKRINNNNASGGCLALSGFERRHPLPNRILVVVWLIVCGQQKSDERWGLRVRLVGTQHSSIVSRRQCQQVHHDTAQHTATRLDPSQSIPSPGFRRCRQLVGCTALPAVALCCGFMHTTATNATVVLVLF